jgi:hypothetical protein
LQTDLASACLGKHVGWAGGELFLGGKYIELGISLVGNFGTSAGKPAGFSGTAARANIGMSADYDGFGCGTNFPIDYFLPGGPEERWTVGFKRAGTIHILSQSKLAGDVFTNTAKVSTSLADKSTDSKLIGEVTTIIKSTATNANVLKVVQTISFGVNDQYFGNKIAMTNLDGGDLTEVRYMRNVDPDNWVDQGQHTTIIHTQQPNNQTYQQQK